MTTLEEALGGMKGAKPERGSGILPPAPVFVGKIACFDQTLSKSGFGLVQVTADHKLVPLRTEMFKPTTTEDGHEGNFDQALQLFFAFQVLLARLNPDLVAHEAPPIGGKFNRPESSLMAAQSLRIACKLAGIPVVMIYPREVKKRLTGDAKAQKKDVKLAIERFIPEVADLKPWNQDVSDAIGVGIVASERNT